MPILDTGIPVPEPYARGEFAMKTTTGSMNRRAAQALGMVLALSLGMLAVTCKSPLFGLGGAVDLVAPRSISISPGQGSVRSGVITISGVAEDSYGLASAEVRILNKTTGAELAKFETTISSNSWTTGTIDTAQFVDGPYTIAATLKDARGNASEDRVLITFDNRAPTVLIDTPLDLSAEYNGEIHISGDSYDSLSAISKVTVSVFKDGQSRRSTRPTPHRAEVGRGIQRSRSWHMACRPPTH